MSYEGAEFETPPEVEEYWERDQEAKADAGKLMMELIPSSAYMSLARVLTYGAQKYGPNNWQGVEPDRYIGALLRHLVLFLDEPEGADAESGLLHIEHVLCNAMFLNHLSGKKAKEDR